MAVFMSASPTLFLKFSLFFPFKTSQTKVTHIYSKNTFFSMHCQSLPNQLFDMNTKHFALTKLAGGPGVVRNGLMLEG